MHKHQLSSYLEKTTNCIHENTHTNTDTNRRTHTYAHIGQKSFHFRLRIPCTSLCPSRGYSRKHFPKVPYSWTEPGTMCLGSKLLNHSHTQNVCCQNNIIILKYSVCTYLCQRKKELCNIRYLYWIPKT